jgi:two-component system CheB/CheR fusion protein
MTQLASDEGLFVVGIGSSAGGIEALEGLFRGVQGRTGLAFVIVSHLAPGRESVLPSIVARFTDMKVETARDGQPIAAEQVYVAPPDGILTISEGKLRLSAPSAHRGEPRSIDAFLSSLAEDQGERAIAIVLSGGGSDGSLGLAAVKEHGGLTIAQGADHSVPRYRSMPDSAIATGHVDCILSAEDIGQKLLEYVRSFGLVELQPDIGPEAPPEVVEPALTAREVICSTLREQVGHDFTRYKERTFLRRVQRRMQVLSLLDVRSYVERLRQDQQEVTQLFRDLLINVTSFFRDASAFEALETLVIPQLFAGKGPQDVVRVWIPGCATGEEVYSIAMLLCEQLDRTPAAPRVQIFGTDIDEVALEVARAGRYTPSAVEGVAPARLARFFANNGAVYTVAKPLRDLCIFSAHSVVRDPPFGHLDLISCRNLLIYLDSEAQGQVFPIFHYALKPGGYLLLGSAESVGQQTHMFSVVDKKARLFQRTEGPTPAQFPLAVPGLRFPPLIPENRPVTAPGLQRTIEAEVLERFSPPHVVVNRDGETVYHSARIGKYLEPPAGLPSRQVLAMARKSLRLDLRAALQQAIETGRAATRNRVVLELETDRVQFLTITVAPLSRNDRRGPLYVVLFTDEGEPVPVEDALGHVGGEDHADQEIRHLQHELRDTRERLQVTIEEYETGLEELRSANEELVSLNEELQSTNEELQTSKEEIQSINEELHTVNRELGIKIEQLDLAKSDLENLFECTRIPMVLLDCNLSVRSFTPAMDELFSLIPRDRGRPLANFTCHLDYPGLHADLVQVVERGESIERRVSRSDGLAHYLMRLLPYRRDGAIRGVVGTFFDITGIVQAERRQDVLIHELNHRVRNMLAVVGSIARLTLARSPDPQSFEPAFLGRIEALGRAYGLVARKAWTEASLEETIREELDPYLDAASQRGRIDGPRVLLRSSAVVSLGMVIHELATNALKHGALAAPEGQIEVIWRVEQGSERPLLLLWQETGGPPARQPVVPGFGSELIRGEICHRLNGTVSSDFSENGLVLRIELPFGPDIMG